VLGQDDCRFVSQLDGPLQAIPLVYEAQNSMYSNAKRIVGVILVIGS
jgi:hypothetical protein